MLSSNEFTETSLFETITNGCRISKTSEDLIFKNFNSHECGERKKSGFINKVHKFQFLTE